MHTCEQSFNWLLGHYETGLKWVLRHYLFTLSVWALTLVATVLLYLAVPKGFFPQQDTGIIMGTTDAAQDISFIAMKELQQKVAKVVLEDPAVATLASFMGGMGASTVNNGRMFITLKPRDQRDATADEVIARLRKKLAGVVGINLFLQAAQDIRVGGRMSRAQFQYSLQSGDLNELNRWSNLLVDKLRLNRDLRDVSSDQQTRGLQTAVVVDRDAASRMGVSPIAIDNTLYDAFGQRQVSTMYRQYNQFHVVLEVEPQYLLDPSSLN
ncbi:MAG: efflux RND transporter permease subunit, partial [Verrucomicrobia bacterium]|nr:efflux RND transporter permease subunit [Verrucomicrobiota bacterium]